jgi:hypothetical protein
MNEATRISCRALATASVYDLDGKYRALLGSKERAQKRKVRDVVAKKKKQRPFLQNRLRVNTLQRYMQNLAKGQGEGIVDHGSKQSSGGRID